MAPHLTFQMVHPSIETALYFVDVAVKNFKLLDEIWATVREIPEDQQKIKMAFMKHLPDEERQDIFKLQ